MDAEPMQVEAELCSLEEASRLLGIVPEWEGTGSFGKAVMTVSCDLMTEGFGGNRTSLEYCVTQA